MASGDDVNLPDLQVIQRYSLAVRGATAPRDDVVSALQADLAWLTGNARRTTPSAAPTTPVKAPARKAPAPAAAKAPAKAATKAATRTPATKKPAAKKSAP